MAKDGYSDNKQTNVGRFTWLAVFSPSTTGYKGVALKTPRYSATIIIPKTHPDPRFCQNYQMLMGLLVEAARTGIPGGQIPPMDRKDFPIRDCDADAADLAKHPYTAGHWKIKAGTERKPAVFVAPNPQPVLLPEINGKPTVKSGDYGVLSVHAYCWSDKKGLSFGLEALAKTQDGEALGSGDRDGSEIFAGLLQPGAAGAQQGYHQPPGPGQTYAPQPSYNPPPPPAPQPPQDPRISWPRDPSGQWVQNPQTGQWEAAPPPQPPQQPAYTPPPQQPGGYQPPLAQFTGQPQYAQTPGYPVNSTPSTGQAPGVPVPYTTAGYQGAAPSGPAGASHSNGVPPVPQVPQYAQPQYQPLQPPQQGFTPPLGM